MVRSKITFQYTFFVMALISYPYFLWTPVYGFVRFPVILASTSKTKGFESHGFQSYITGQYQKVGPRKFVTIFLFDWPQQTACFVQIGVIWPAVQGRKTLLTPYCTTTTILYTVRTGSVPSHTNKERSVMSIIRRPPILTVRH